MFVGCSKLIDQMMLILPAMYQNDQGDFGITIKCGGTEMRCFPQAEFGKD